MNVFGVSHQGLLRADNEDRFLIREAAPNAFFLAVADGMGGLEAGALAAQITIDTCAAFSFASNDPEGELLRLAVAADRAVIDEVRRNPSLSRMGSTITAAAVLDGTAYWVHVGDSRLYRYSRGELLLETRDHNLAQQFVDAGKLTAEEARLSEMRNILLQCIGCGTCKPDTGRFPLQSGDRLLLSSDGLHGAVPHKKLAALLQQGAEAEGTAKKLIEAALKAGGEDNVTVIIADF